MVNRILLEPSNGAKVSLPGINVLSAQPWELLFLSQNAQLSMKETGEISYPGYGSFFVNFANTYSAPPITVLAAQYGATYAGPTYNEHFRFLAFGAITQNGSSAAGYTRNRNQYFRVETQVNGILHSFAAIDPFNGQPCPPIFIPYPLRYYVFDMEF